MNKSGGIVTQILIMLIVVVATSATVLILIQTGVLTVRADADTNILDSSFLPYAKEGHLLIKNFQFCTDIDARYQCLEPKDTFKIGEKVYFLVDLESSVTDGAVKLVKNYRIRGPDGKVMLEANAKNTLNFETKSVKEKERIKLKDYFIPVGKLPTGEYTIELTINNILIEQKVQLSETFELEAQP